MNFKEVAMVLPLVLLFFVIGLFPNLFFDKINPSVEAMVGATPAIVAPHAGAAPAAEPTFTGASSQTTDEAGH
jgi:NADH-quinone oxidoreductase subunit M